MVYPIITMKERDVYADLLRSTAVFFVILIHVDAIEWYAQPAASYEWQVLNLFDSISRWVVPVFFMLSGAYLLDPEKEITVKDVYSKYIRRIVTVLIFWGLVYQFYDIIDAAVCRDTPFTPAALLQIPGHFIFGFPAGHLWFLYRLTALYMLTPVLRIYTARASRRNMEYLITLYLIAGSLLPFISKILKNEGSTLAVSFKIIELTGFAFYYLAGYYFRTYDVPRRLQAGIYAAGIAGAVTTALLTSYFTGRSGVKTEDFYDNLTPGVIFMALSVFTGFKQLFGKRQFSEKQKAVIGYLSSCSFGMYLTHYMFIKIAFRMHITCTMYNPVFFLPVLALGFFLLSLAVTSILRFIKPVRRYLM